MGYSPPKKPLDLKEFLSKKGTPRRSGWQNRTGSTVRKPTHAATTPAPEKPAPKKG